MMNLPGDELESGSASVACSEEKVSIHSVSSLSSISNILFSSTYKEIEKFTANFLVLKIDKNSSNTR